MNLSLPLTAYPLLLTPYPLSLIPFACQLHRGAVVRTAVGTGGTIHYYHRNGQYSITAMTTSTGEVEERYAFAAYGQPTIYNASGSPIRNQQSQIANRFTYKGHEWDETLCLHHFRARWVSPLAGRFLGRDPIGYDDGLSLYRSYMSLFDFDPHGTNVRLRRERNPDSFCFEGDDMSFFSVTLGGETGIRLDSL
ncbi:MAG: hypothetical protein MUC43_13075 [Pirellula sp.]|nr:hypothetical protein [Pirellula sp.]